MYPAPYARIRSSDDRLMVCRHPKFELRLELKLVAVKLSCRNSIVACKLFEQTLVDTNALVRLNACHEPCSFEPCNIAVYGGALITAHHNSFRLDICRIVPENIPYDINES